VWLRVPVLLYLVPLNELAKVEQDEVLRRVSLWAYYLLRPPVFDRFLLYELFSVDWAAVAYLLLGHVLQRL